jgi:hypothetical protein
METYTQCRFRKGDHFTIGWIPSHAAKIGNKVELLSLDGEFWDVISAGAVLPKDQVKDNERNYKDFQHSIK